jgi:hypothetical protein
VLFKCGNFVLFLPVLLCANTVISNWTGAVSNAYTNPGNWDNGVPVNGGGNVFNAGIAAPFNNPVMLGTGNNITIDSLSLQNANGLVVGNSNTFTVNNQTFLSNGSTLVLNSGTNASLGGLINSGTVTAYGTLSLPSMVGNGGAIQLLGGAQMTTSGFTNVLSGFNGQVVADASTFTVNGGVFTGGAVYAQNAGILNFNGAFVNGTVNVNTSGVLNVNGASLVGTTQIGLAGSMVTAAASSNTIDGSLTNAGQITVANSTLSLNAGGAYANNGTIGLTNNALLAAQINGSQNIVTLGGTGIINLQGSTLAASATLVLGSGQTVQGVGNLVGSTIDNQGTLHATGPSGIAINSASFTNTGAIVADTLVSISAGTLTNYANNTLTGGTYDATGVIGIPNADIHTNQASIVLHDSGFIGGNGDALANFNLNDTSGSFAITGSKVFAAPSGGFTNNGAVDIGAGTIFVMNSGDQYTQNSGSTIVDGQLLQAGNVVLNGGTLSGIGEIHGNLTSNGATIAPGDAPGPLTIFGDYMQLATSELDIEFASLTAYGQLDIAGPLATIQGGILRFVADPGFDAQLGQIFWILNAGQVNGDFDSYTTNYFAGSKMFKEVVSGNAIGAEVVPSPEPAAACWVALALAGILARAGAQRRLRE